ncbi:hypothetical protein [Streptomyces sp. MMBL 11-1]|uniref:hypothetical protein n=1 Tax=Streptomyces sp. MMBL 11-1 TaxID=3026420 RepID=UPI00235DD6B3|nr:hypothetical protein [Streptomyces sp. MMBL 11-1]
MTMSDVAAQIVSIFVSALGLVIFRLIAKYLPEDPDPVPRPRRRHPHDDTRSEDDRAL